MSKRIFYAFGKACIAANRPEAVGKLLPDGSKAAIWDLTEPLIDLIESTLGAVAPARGAGVMAIDPLAVDDQAAINRLQSELGALAGFADDCQSKYLLKHRDLVAAQAVVEQLKLERHELLKTIDGHIDTGEARKTELAALHASVEAYRGENEKLREMVALMEAAAESDERTAARSQEMAAWEAEQKLLRKQSKKADPDPVVIETDLVTTYDLALAGPENSSGEAAVTGALPGPLEASPPAAMACLPAGSAPESSPSEPLVVRNDESSLEAQPLLAAPLPAAVEAPKRGRQPLDPKFDDEVRRVFRAGGDNKAIAASVCALGKDVTELWAKNRVQILGLKAAERAPQVPADDKPGRGPKSPTGQALVAAAAKPAEAVTPRSRQATMWGALIVQYVDEHYGPDDIAEMINAQAARADRVTVQDVRKVIQEIKRLNRNGEAA